MSFRILFPFPARLRRGVLPGTLYNLARDRLKDLDHKVRSRLSAYAVQDLEQEIESLGRQLEMAHRLGRSPDQEAVRRLRVAHDRAQRLLNAYGAGA